MTESPLSLAETPPARRPARLAWIGAAAVAIAAVAAGAAWFTRKPRPIPLLGPQTEQIVRGVYMLRGLGPSVAYAIETSEGPVLIDSGLESDAGPLRNELGKLLIDWRSIKAVFLTHAHGDHCGGAEYLRTHAGAKVYAGRDDAPIIQAGGPREAVFSAFYMPHHAPHKTTVDEPIAVEEELVFGDTRIRAIPTPGHTPGSTCYLLERDGHRILFSGDVIMHLGEASPLGTYSAYLAPRYRGDPAAYLETLRELQSMPAPDVVLPGHPPLGPVPDDPRMTRDRWHGMLFTGVREMETLLERSAKDGRDFLDGEPKALLPGLYYLGDRAGISVYAVATRGHLMIVNAPGGDGLADFVADRVKSLKITPETPSIVLLTSCEPESASGLKSLLARWKADVVVSASGLEAARSLVPRGTTLAGAGTASSRLPMAISGHELRGPSVGEAAYLLTLEGKKILFTGRVPRKLDEEVLAKLSESPGSRASILDELDALRALEPLRPDLWLPQVPVHGQNADLYGREWDDLMAGNYRVGHARLRRSETPAGRPSGGG